MSGFVNAGLCLYHIFIFAGLLPVIAAIGYCLFTDQLPVLIQQYFLYYFYYSYQYSPTPLAERFSPINIIIYYYSQYTFAAYWNGLLLLIGIGLWRSRQFAFNWSSTLLMVVAFWIVSVYETIQAGTNYEHYLNLVLVPHTLLAALLLYPRLSQHQLKRGPVIYGYLTIALLITFFSHTVPYARGYDAPLPYDAEVVTLIKKECSPQDRIAVWGWADRYYALSGVAPASRYNNCVLQVGAISQQNYYLTQYIQDLQQTKPILFLDAVADNQFKYTDQNRFGHEQFTSLNQFVSNYYQLIYEREGLRAYKLKSEHNEESVLPGKTPKRTEPME